MAKTVVIKKKKQAWRQRAVSRKFYDEVCSRVHEVASISADINPEHLIKCIDEYLDSGSVASSFSMAEKVVFALLQPYIDKAVERSRRARQAAARRRQALTDDAPCILTAADTDNATADGGFAQAELAGDFSAATDRLTRDRLKAQRREEARTRRLEKHRKRMARHAHHRNSAATDARRRDAQP